MMVSEVGRMTSGSSSSSPPPCVTTASSGENPATCDFSLSMKLPRNQQRKGRVHVAGGLEAAVERRGNVFPERPAVGPHDHAAAHRRVIRQFRAQNQLVVPLRVTLGACQAASCPPYPVSLFSAPQAAAQFAKFECRNRIAESFAFRRSIFVERATFPWRPAFIVGDSASPVAPPKI